jgi:hypothetical protein
MGITASYRRIKPEKFAELQNNPQVAASFFEWDEDSYGIEGIDISRSENKENYFSLEKDWHALHFLLTGDTSMSMEENTQVLPPLCNVVIGGTPTEFDATYGFVRYLTPEEVREVADALSQISAEELKGRFNPNLFKQGDIYPGGDGWDEDQIEFLLNELYPELLEFFQKAAKEGDIMLLSSN